VGVFTLQNSELENKYEHIERNSNTKQDVPVHENCTYAKCEGKGKVPQLRNTGNRLRRLGQSPHPPSLTGIESERETEKHYICTYSVFILVGENTPALLRRDLFNEEMKRLGCP